MSYFSGTVNAMPKGGSTSSDARTGLGIGSLSKGPASGLGSNYSMGDALSSPKGEWDNELDLEEDFDDIYDEIERLAFSSFNVTPTDSLAHRGTGIGYLGGIGADMSAVIGMSASYQPKGDIIVEQQLKEYIKEALIIEKSVSAISSSGRIAVMFKPKVKNLGSNDAYSIDKTSASTNTSDAPPKGRLPTSRSAINHSGYYQSHDATTDGAKTLYDPLIGIYYEEDADAFDSGESTGDIAHSFNDERADYLNKIKHI